MEQTQNIQNLNDFKSFDFNKHDPFVGSPEWDKFCNEFMKLSYDDKRSFYGKFFTSGNNLKLDFEDKILLVRLLCYFTFMVRKKKADAKPIDCLEFIIQRKINPEDIKDKFLVGLGIVCEDFLYGVVDVKAPEGFASSQEVANEIKRIWGQWLPF